MGNKNIKLEQLDKNLPVLIWIDKKVNNKEYSEYIKYIKEDLKFQVFGFNSVKKSYEYLKKLEFIDTYIICSGKKYIKLVEILKKNINELMICPKIIIFTLNKKKYYKRNLDNKELSLDDPFYNWGGVEDKFKDIIKFLKNEKTNKTIEFDINFDKLIIKKLQNDINKKNNENKDSKDYKKLKSNDNYESDEVDYKSFFSSLYNENIEAKINNYISPNIKNKFNENDDIKALFSKNIDSKQFLFSLENINNISDNIFPTLSENINNINDELFLFLSENKNNLNDKKFPIPSENTKNINNEKMPYTSEKINKANEEHSLCVSENINNINDEKFLCSSEKSNNINNEKILSPSENINNISGEHFPFPSKNENNEEKNSLFSMNNKQDYFCQNPHIENDILNPFRDLNEDQLDTIKRFEDGGVDEDESIQYNFENITNFKQLILPIFLYIYINNPKTKGILEFNHYMLTHYSNVQKLVNLISQINISYQIPNEVTSKYWVRAYTAQSNFHKEMNKDLRLGKFDKYLTFIHMMYNGVKIKSFSFNPKSKLYRGAKFGQKEIESLELSLRNKSSDFPHSIIFIKSFLSFSLNREIAMKFIKNVLLIIEEFTEGAINCPGCAAIKKFSFIKNEEEILVFPFTCFEVKSIEKMEEEEKIEEGKDINKTYYIIHLDYLGKYEEKFNDKDPDDLFDEIPEESHYAQQVFSTDILDGKYKERFFGKNSQYVDNDNNKNNNNNNNVICYKKDNKKEKILVIKNT